ncbi:MAG TPA: hypothetical protein ENK80_06690, partial [Rhodobacterales bacterium]|nr:hypothetical protein [Rhodobacterales bacterium]
MTEFLEFLKSQAILLVAISASITILSFLVRPLRGFLTRHRPSHVVITNPEALPGPASPAQPTITLTLAQFEDRLARREAEIRAEFRDVQPANFMALKNELDELIAQKTDPETAFETRAERIRDLGKRLAHDGGALKASALQAAQVALAAGDPALADGLFGEIAEKADGAAARAHFARGKIAEGALRWA